MIGNGEANIRTVVSIAQSQALDSPLSGAMADFASLGAGGSATANEERDLHRWLKDLYNVHLEPYTVSMTLQALCPHLRFRLTSSEVRSFRPQSREAMDAVELQELQVPVLLPHELLHSLVHAGLDQAKSKVTFINFHSCAGLRLHAGRLGSRLNRRLLRALLPPGRVEGSPCATKRVGGTIQSWPEGVF